MSKKRYLANGGKPEGTQILSWLPTREEFIQSKIDSTRNAAYIASVNRTEPVIIPPKKDKYYYDNLEYYTKMLKDSIRIISDPSKDIAERADALKGAKFAAKRIKYCNPSDANCIYTALTNYGPKHRVTGNQTFRNNPSKYGFKEIQIKDIKPGDLVQYTNYDSDVPKHAAIYDHSEGNRIKINYSNGYDMYKVNGYFGENPKYAYTFVGTPADSVEWNNRYDSLLKRVGFSNGGSIYIKPSHRGRFTALKERTGHSATWFKENGTPAQKKMATFALNAARWKH